MSPSLLPHLINGMKSGFMTATGVPPYVSILLRMLGVEMELSNLPPLLVEQLEEMLQRNGAAAANVTPEGIHDAIKNALAKFLPERLEQQDRMDVEQVEPISPTLFHWEGSFHKLPQDYKFPDASVSAAYRIWHFGIEEENLVSFKSLEPRDLSDKNARKRLSDWKYLMNGLEEALGEDGDEEVTKGNISARFKLAMERLPRVPKMKRGREEDWTVGTATRELRMAKRPRPGERHD